MAGSGGAASSRVTRGLAGAPRGNPGLSGFDTNSLKVRPAVPTPRPVARQLNVGFVDEGGRLRRVRLMAIRAKPRSSSWISWNPSCSDSASPHRPPFQLAHSIDLDCSQTRPACATHARWERRYGRLRLVMSNQPGTLVTGSYAAHIEVPHGGGLLTTTLPILVS